MQQIPDVGAVVLADNMGPDLSGSKLRLFVSGYVPTPADTLTGLLANECTFSGYQAGGYTLTTWSNAMLQPGGGAWTASPQVDVYFTPPGSGSPVTQTVGGWWVQDATGNLIADGTFTPAVPMVKNGDGFTVSVALFQGSTTQDVAAWVNGNQQP